MKLRLFASTMAAALTTTTLGQVNSSLIESCCSPWQVIEVPTRLSFSQDDCSGYTTWDFSVWGQTKVTYYVELLGCGKPSVDSFLGSSGPFEKIESDWYALGQPMSWSGTFTLDEDLYEFITFFEFKGTMIFCEVGTDTDGDGVDDCSDRCPEDPFKSTPGDCGCGVEDLDSDKDGVANCVDNCPDDTNKTDPGACGCGNEDTDTDGDGTADCVDNCPGDPNKTEPENCGCDVPETDVFGDLDCDGDYDIDDIRLGMTTFGIKKAEEDTCPADVDGDGSIGFSDVLIILNDWGACP